MGFINFNPMQSNFIERYVLRRKLQRPETDFGEAYAQTVVEANKLLQRLKDMGVDRRAPKTIQAIEKMLEEGAAALAENDERAAYNKGQASMQRGLHEVLEYEKGKDRLKELLIAEKMPDKALSAELVEMQKRITGAGQILSRDPVSDRDYGKATDLYFEYDALKKKVVLDRATENVDIRKAYEAGREKLNVLAQKLDRILEHDDVDEMKVTALIIRDDLDKMKAELDSGDFNRINAAHPQAAALTGRLSALEGQIDAVIEANCRQNLPTDHGCTPAEVDALIALGIEDEAAMNAAVLQLQELDQKLNGAAVDQHNLEHRALATTEAWKEINREKVALTAAKGAMEQAISELLQADGALPNPADPVRDAVAIQLRDTKQQELEQRRQDVLAAEAKVEEAAKAHADTQAAEQAAQTKRALLDSVRFGPLSPNHAHLVEAPHAAALIALYGQNLDIAQHAVSIAANAKNPESVVMTAQTVCARMDDRFEARNGKKLPLETEIQGIGEVDLSNYGERLVTMSANIPPAQAAGLDAYLDDGRHLRASNAYLPKMKDGEANLAATGKSRVDHVGGKMMENGPPMDLVAGRRAMEDLMFNPLGLKSPSYAQVGHMLETFDLLEGTQEARDIINNAQPPMNDTARQLVSRTTGMVPQHVTGKHTGEAILTAMMTPVYQGKVGSCFVTAGVLQQRQEKPLKTMQDLETLATEGKFIPGTGPEVPAVKLLPADENALQRSHEYTAATAAARLNDGINKKALNKTNVNAVKTLSPKFKSKKDVDAQNRLAAALNDAFDFVYDARVTAAGPSRDGSSTKGGTKLVDKATGKVIESEADYLKVVHRILEEQVQTSDTRVFVSAKDVADRVYGNDFRAALRQGHQPWKPSDGGMPDEAAEILEGGAHELETITPRVSKSRMDQSKRAEEIMVNLLGIGDGTGMKPIGVLGSMNHAFNALPEHPSFVRLKGANAEETALNVQREVIQKGQDLCNEMLPVDRAVYMFDKQLKALIAGAAEPAKTSFLAALKDDVPTAPIAAKDLTLLIKGITEKAADLAATVGALNREERKTEKRTKYLEKAEEKRRQKKAAKKGKKLAARTPEEEAAWQEKLKKDLQKWYESDKKQAKKKLKRKWDTDVANQMIDDLGLPEIVIADTNWGNPNEHQNFVIAPDPATGLMQFYVRTEPTGKLYVDADATAMLADQWLTTKLSA